MKNRLRKNLWPLGLAAFWACQNDGIHAPIDAHTRERIDSISNAQIRLSRAEIDSFYSQNRSVLLKKMMDSLTVVRRREIAEQIKSAQNGQ